MSNSDSSSVASASDGMSLRVFLSREITVEVFGNRSTRTSVLGEGSIKALPPGLSGAHRGEEVLDWEGEVRACDIQTGGFFTESFVVKVSIVCPSLVWCIIELIDDRRTLLSCLWFHQISGRRLYYRSDTLTLLGLSQIHGQTCMDTLRIDDTTPCTLLRRIFSLQDFLFAITVNVLFDDSPFGCLGKVKKGTSRIVSSIPSGTEDLSTGVLGEKVPSDRWEGIHIHYLQMDC